MSANQVDLNGDPIVVVEQGSGVLVLKKVPSHLLNHIDLNNLTKGVLQEYINFFEKSRARTILSAYKNNVQFRHEFDTNVTNQLDIMAKAEYLAKLSVIDIYHFATEEVKQRRLDAFEQRRKDSVIELHNCSKSGCCFTNNNTMVNGDLVVSCMYCGNIG